MEHKLVKHFLDFPTKQDWINQALIRVSFNEKEDFLKIKETLTRIGVQPFKEPVLFQSCHILHKKLLKNDVYESTYFIVHFKELFILDQKPSTISDEDIVRRNTIAKILEDWKLIKILNPEVLDNKGITIPQIKIIKFQEKFQWDLRPKYTIGNKIKL